MSEAVTVKIEINGVVYPVSCMAGEEDRLIESAKEVNKVIASLSNVSETIGETRLLAMTSLILADKLIEKQNTTDVKNNMNELINNIKAIKEEIIIIKTTLEREISCLKNFLPHLKNQAHLIKMNRDLYRNLSQ